MGSQYVDGSPGWDSIGSNLASSFMGAPQKALSNMSAADQIWIEREKAMRERAIWEAKKKNADAFPGTLPAAPDAGPVPFDAIGPMVGDVNSPIDTAGIPRQPLTYIDPAKVAALDRYNKEKPYWATTGRSSALQGKTNEAGKLYTESQVALGGVPTDPQRRMQLNALSTGKIEAPSTDNYRAIAPDGSTIKVWSSPDGGATDVTGKNALAGLPENTQIVKAGASDLSAKAPTIFDTKASMQNALIDASIRIGNGGAPPDPAMTQKLEYALREVYPEINKVMTTAIGDSSILHNFVETMPPGPLKPLMEHIARTRYPAAAPAAAAPGSVFSTGAAPVTDTSSGGLVGTPVPTAAPPPATPILPGYDPNAPQRQTVLTQRPATAEQTKLNQALATVSNERGAIERLMKVTRGPDGKLMVPPGAYTPSWAASLVYDAAGTAGIPGKILNAMDPQAREYFLAGRTWVEPVLRIATGAVAPQEEVVSYMQRFIPDANDSDTMKAQKLTRMRIWEGAARASATAGDALKMIISDPETDPEAKALAESFRVRAYENNTLNTPVEHLPPTPSRGAAVPGASPRSSYRPPVVDDPSVDSIVKPQR